MRFLRVAEALERVAETRGTNAKRDLVAALLRDASDEELPHVARFASGSPFARADERTLQAGWSTLERAALALLPTDETVWRACQRAVGDTGETLALLLEAYPPAAVSPQRTLFDLTGDGAPFDVLDAADAFARLAAAPPSAKGTLLDDAWRRMRPIEAKYFTKLLTGGMRIGLAESLVEEAIAVASSRDVERVRLAAMLTGDVGETARLAREDRLHEARFALFHPLGFMLASPADAPPDDVSDHLVEDKLDGIRAQLHVGAGRAALFTRTLDEAAEFPEVVEAARRIPRDVVLDGEVVAVREDGRPAPFALLQRRLGRKRVEDAMRREIPVRYVAYDVLWLDGVAMYERPIEERRAALDALDLAPPLLVSPLIPAATKEEALRAFDAARERGNEGLMLKRRGSAYELGKRGQQWLKLKKPLGTLDVVVTAAELGHGKRAGLLSDVTFAVRGRAGELLNVGKAFTGLTDEEIREMTALLKQLTIERYASAHLVRPEIVLEVAFDGVTRSPRHKSGYALRFPRIVRWRKDKPPADVDTIERVLELWLASGGAEALGAGRGGADGSEPF